MPAQPRISTSAPSRSRSCVPTSVMRASVVVSSASAATPRPRARSPAKRSMTPMAPKARRWRGMEAGRIATTPKRWPRVRAVATAASWIPRTGLAVRSRSACRPGSPKQAMTKPAASSSVSASERSGGITRSACAWLSMPGGPSEGEAADLHAHAVRHRAQRIEGRVYPVGHGLRGIGVDDVERDHDLVSGAGLRRLLDLDLVALGVLEDEGADADGVVDEKPGEVRQRLRLGVGVPGVDVFHPDAELNGARFGPFVHAMRLVHEAHMGAVADLHDLGEAPLVDRQRKAHHVAVEGLGAGQILVIEKGDGKDVGAVGPGHFGRPVMSRGSVPMVARWSHWPAPGAP